ncbi:lipopolysaccharide assembly protein LapA domain-containing protein [Alteromonas sp. 5E99-2]|uniref:lipopolysaccharide assembly protein LapA domain-containing protein n=1 Tax=Alteromonas sp. 5E99-2 TaxID=2817683 RepID=UPI00325B6BB5
MKGLLSIILVVFILLVAIAVGSQNSGEITVNYLLAQAQIKVSTFIAITLGCGILVGVLLVTPAFLHARMKLAFIKQKQQ